MSFSPDISKQVHKIVFSRSRSIVSHPLLTFNNKPVVQITKNIQKCSRMKIFFFSIRIFFHEHSRFTGQQGKGKGFSFNSSLPLPPALIHTLRHQSTNYCRELTSTQSQQLNSNQKPLVSEHKSLTNKLRALYRRSFGKQ